MIFAVNCVCKELILKLYEAFLHSHSIQTSRFAPFLTLCPFSNSSYWSHAGLHSTGREESGFAAQLPPRFSQVRINSHHTTRDSMSCLTESKMSCYVHIHISAARLVANPQDIRHEIDFPLQNIFLLRLTLNSIL